MLILCLPFNAFAAWVADTSFETTNGTTAPTDGVSLEATGDGTGWSDNWTTTGTGDWLYDDDITGQPNGTWIANADTTGNNYEPTLDRTLTDAMTSGDVTYYYNTSKTNRDQHGFWLRDGTTLRMYITTNPQASGNSDLIDVTGTIAAAMFGVNTWYKIRIDFDCTTDTFDVYVDGVLKGDNRAFSSASVTLNFVRFITGAASTAGSTAGSSYRVDFIQPTPGGAATPATRVIIFE